MSFLEELVTSTLPEITEEREFTPLPPLEIRGSASRVSEDEIIQLCQDFRQDLPTSPRQAPYRLVQLLMYMQLTLSVRSVMRPEGLFALAATYALSGEEELRRKLEAWSEEVEGSIVHSRERRAEEAMIGDDASQIDFLREIFADDLSSELVAVTGVRLQTAKRWINGGSRPSLGHRKKIRMLARALYSARYRVGMDNEQIIAWYEQPFSGGESPREMFSNFRIITEDNFAAALAAIGWVD